MKGFMLEGGDRTSAVGSGDVISKFAAAAAGAPSCISAFLGPAHIKTTPPFVRLARVFDNEGSFEY